MNIRYQDKAQIYVRDIKNLCAKIDVPKIQERYWFEIYVDSGCGSDCYYEREKKCGDLEHYGTCAWNYVAFVHCKSCGAIVDTIDKKTLESIGWPVKELDVHYDNCQRFRLRVDRFKLKMRGLKVIREGMQITEVTHDTL